MQSITKSATKAVLATVVLTGIIAISGCSNMSHRDKTIAGSLVGAGVGAGVGSMVGGSSGAVVGAAAGAVGGGLVGHDMAH